jgi:hypothetical protein
MIFIEPELIARVYTNEAKRCKEAKLVRIAKRWETKRANRHRAGDVDDAPSAEVHLRVERKQALR